MATVELGAEGQFRVRLVANEDAAALRVGLRAVDGAHQVNVILGADLSFSLENPFNAFALWLADFEMTHAALKAVLDAIAPIAWSHMSIHSGGFQKLSMRRIRELRPQGDPPKGNDA